MQREVRNSARFSKVVGALCALWFTVCAQAASSADTAGTVKTLKGSATVVRGSGSIPVELGQRLQAGDRIVSAPASYVGITLQDDTRLTIGPGAEMLVRAFEFDPNSHVGNMAIAFLKGTARVVTGILARHAPERVSFHTPTMTIGIRGTDFIVDLEEQP